MSTYVEQPTYPTGTPTATIYIDGLLALCFKDKQRCTVAVNQQGTHLPEFEIWKWTPETPTKPAKCEQITVNLPPNYQKVVIKVNKVIVSPPTKGVTVYTGPSRTAPDEERHNIVDNWVDIEGVRGNKHPVKNRPKTLWPRFYIDHGLFCAYRLSTAPFDLNDPTGRMLTVPLEQVALAIAADIFLVSGESIEIMADGSPLSPPVELPFGARYEIGIFNRCLSTMSPSDFHLHYDVLEVTSPPVTKYALSNRTGLGSPSRTMLGHCVGGGGPRPVSDRAPCMSVVYGQTNDFVD